MAAQFPMWMKSNDVQNPDFPAPAAEARLRVRLFTICAVALVAVFAVPLWQLIRHAVNTHLHSHILLIPFVSGYLFMIGKRTQMEAPRSSITAGCVAAICGLVALVFYLLINDTVDLNDTLSVVTLSFLALQLANALFFIGWPVLRSRFFPIAFLVFMIPLPLAVTEFISIMLQLASAEVAAWMLSLTSMPVFRSGLTFQFPGLAIYVAEECSGVRSTFMLFITSLIAGHLFLRTGWKKAVLALAIFPLGILRNAFRITTISWLTVNVDRGIIDSPLHHRGGPIFFALSLIPLFGLLWAFRRSDRRKP